MDLFNREVIGYDIGKKIDTQLVKNALGNSIGRRGLTDGLIFHRDRGCQYTSNGYQDMLKEKSIQGCMNRPGCPYDNFCAGSFFILKKEKIYRRKYDTMEEVKRDVFWYIELFYNPKRRHSTLQCMTPMGYVS